MAYGGGIFSVQDKVLPGAYINFSTVSGVTSSSIGERGTVAIAMPIMLKDKVVEWTFDDFKASSKSVFGVDWNYSQTPTTKEQKCVRALREIFCNANKVVVGGLLSARTVQNEAENDFLIIEGSDNYNLANYGFRVDMSFTAETTEEKSRYNIFTYFTRNGNLVNSHYFSNVYYLKEGGTKRTWEDVLTLFVAEFNAREGMPATLTLKEDISGLISKFEHDETVTNGQEVFQIYSKNVLFSSELDTANPKSEEYKSTLEELVRKPFNILVCNQFETAETSNPVVDAADLKEMYHTFTVKQRNDFGLKFQTVYYDYLDVNHEAAISLAAANNSDLIFWTAGALAGVSFSQSLCNRTYDGELQLGTLGADVSQGTLRAAMQSGQFIFHMVGDEVRVLDDINTYIKDETENLTHDPEIFGDNQSIRIIDQISNDVATIFINNYLGKVPATDSGRTMFWNELIDYHEQMQELGGITGFTSNDIQVAAGSSRNSVVVVEAITLAATMKKLYMQITVA